MYYYKATIQYDGTDYFGFQWQKDIPTIQNDINLALAKIFQGKVTTMGSSRTDSGVHAQEQFVKITAEQFIEPKLILQGLDEYLPRQIKCLSLSQCEGEFNPTTGHKSKEYRYLFTNNLKTSCLDQRFISNTPYVIDVSKMRKCTQMIQGKHSFHNFVSMGSNVKTTIREVYECDLTIINPHDILVGELFKISIELTECYELRIVGSGFLKQMVRHLMSAMWLVGNGRMSLNDFDYLLNGPIKDKRLWKVASSRGLHLYKFN